MSGSSPAGIVNQTSRYIII